MIELPAYLNPDSVELIIPSQSLTSNGYLNGLQGRKVKKLSDLHTKAGLKLLFTDHPIDLIQRTDCSSHKALSIGGYALAYKWYRDETISGLRSLTIPIDHPLWSTCNYRIKLQNYTDSISYKIGAFDPPTSKHSKIASWSMSLVVMSVS